MTPSDHTAAGDDTPTRASDQALFRRTLIRVMAVQVAALFVLWLLQFRYSP